MDVGKESTATTTFATCDTDWQRESLKNDRWKPHSDELYEKSIDNVYVFLYVQYVRSCPTLGLLLYI